MSNVTPEMSVWLDQVLDAVGRSGGPGGARGAASEDPAAPAESALAGQIRAATSAGGINVAIYMIGDPDKNNDKEFKRQAVTWAGNHGAFGMSGSTIKRDHAMPLSKDPGKLVSELLAAIQKELKTTDTIPIANVALFSHGGKRSMQIDSTGAGGGEVWASAGSNVVKDFTAAVKPSLGAGAKIHLFACTAAKDRDPAKDRDDATRVDSFAEDLQEQTGAEVWGHENAAHTTGNTRLVQVSDTDSDSNAERYQLRDVLTRKFLQHVDSDLTESQMGYLEQKLKLSTWIKNSLRFKGSGSAKLDRHQVFVEEISMMGFDKLFDLLISDPAPSATTFRTLFPQHDQIDKLVEGAAAVHAEFHKDLEKKKTAITAAKAAADYPAS